MTLVVCWLEVDKITCVADTRISAGEATFSDSGAKLFSIPITTSIYKNGEIFNSKHHSLGFAFAGSTFLATNTHALASTCTQLLIKDAGPSLPSARSIAELYAKIGDFVTKDVNSRRQQDYTFFDSFIFGYCPSARAFKLFFLQSSLASGSFNIIIHEFDPERGEAYSIGSGAQVFRDLSQEMISKGQKVGPLTVFREVVQRNVRPDVGGHIQIGEAKQTGVEFTPILAPDEDNPDHVKLTLLGLDISSIGNVDGFNIGHRGVGIGVEKVAGRQALRAKGIDPDQGPISNEVQNEASLEVALRYCAEKGTKLVLSDTLDLSPIRPAMGLWYYVISCSQCSADTPVCIDPSSGKLGNVFKGAGILRSTCWKCGQAVLGGATELKAFCWNLPTQ